MIFVTSGTQSSFPRLMDMVNAVSIDEEIIYQDGNLLSIDEYQAIFKSARVVISHAGIGTLFTALYLKKPLIVVPRLYEFGEKCNNHQKDTADYFQKMEYVYVANNVYELQNLLSQQLVVHPLRIINRTLYEEIGKLVSNKRLLAVCSRGGHYIELKQLLGEKQCFWTTTGNNSDFQIKEIRRWDVISCFKTLFKLMSIIKKTKSEMVISTGAAPGFLALIAAKLMQKDTIWVDSLSCINHISLSGRLSLPFCNHFYTQWLQNSHGKIKYVGGLLS